MTTPISATDSASTTVRTSPSPDCAPDLKANVLSSPSTLFDLLINRTVGGSSGKMFQAYSVQTGGVISQLYYHCLPDAKLECPNKGLVQPDLFAMLDGTDSEWHGECWTLNMSEYPAAFPTEFPSVAVVASLSDILVTGVVPRKYYLSRSACLGLLRRAEKRGKRLPALLEAVLKMQAQFGCVLDAKEEEREPLSDVS